MNFFKKLFEKKPDYKKMYEEQKLQSQNWEFKYNKLHRQLKEILAEH
jgi:hypothetical protein